jgi:hypothetical protein
MSTVLMRRAGTLVLAGASLIWADPTAWDGDATGAQRVAVAQTPQVLAVPVAPVVPGARQANVQASQQATPRAPEQRR